MSRAVNDAPTVAGDGTENAAPIVEDMPSPTGQSVASLFGGQYSDAADQVAGRLLGRRLRRRRGHRQRLRRAPASGNISTASTWVNIGPASNGAAVLLAAATSIRFNPALGLHRQPRRP